MAQNNPHKQKLIEMIEERKYKITYTSKEHDKEAILQAIANDDIELGQCWSQLEESQFRKLRAGRIMDRTPPSRAEKQRKTLFLN